MLHQGFFDLLDILEREGAVGPQRFFSLMQSIFPVRGLLYLEAQIGFQGLRAVRLSHTFGPHVEDMYRARRFYRIDPVLKLMMTEIRPINWEDARRRFPDSEPLFRTLEKLDVPTQGISVPLLTRSPRIALLSINADMQEAEWRRFLRDHLRDISFLGAMFHAAEQDRFVPPLAGTLTLRESEVLHWIAAGKTYWETAQILGITERTVRFFMTNVRAKLNTATNSQAVAQATATGLLTIP